MFYVYQHLFRVKYVAIVTYELYSASVDAFVILIQIDYLFGVLIDSGIFLRGLQIISLGCIVHLLDLILRIVVCFDHSELLIWVFGIDVHAVSPAPYIQLVCRRHYFIV